MFHFCNFCRLGNFLTISSSNYFHFSNHCVSGKVIQFYTYEQHRNYKRNKLWIERLWNIIEFAKRWLSSVTMFSPLNYRQQFKVVKAALTKLTSTYNKLRMKIPTLIDSNKISFTKVFQEARTMYNSPKNCYNFSFQHICVSLKVTLICWRNF